MGEIDRLENRIKQIEMTGELHIDSLLGRGCKRLPKPPVSLKLEYSTSEPTAKVNRSKELPW